MDCVLYTPGHFGNSYEVMGENEMRSVLQEAKFWGFNRYGDWFNMDDCIDPFRQTRVMHLSHVLWDRKKTNFWTAQSLGFACDFMITPNHVYVDQCLPELEAVQSERIFGQLICPSKPRARQIILSNYEKLFSDLARSNIKLSALVAAPYDYGGCDCERCKPWILTFARLTKEIYAIGQRYFPDLEMHMIGWWWSEEEHRLFAEWADQEAPKWVRRIYLWIPYDQISVLPVPLPEDCEKAAFVHIGYSDRQIYEDRGPLVDIYGHLGPVIAPERLPQTVNALKKAGCQAVMAYSEGLFDDVNKALLAGLWSGQFKTADEVLKAYVQRYFQVPPEIADEYAVWLAAWGKPLMVDTEQAARRLAELPSPPDHSNWRWRQWQLKVELFRLHRLINEKGEWTPEKIQLVERFWAVQEEIQRKVWGLGTLRHIFGRRFTPLPWYRSWAEFQAREAGSISQEQ